MTSLTDKIRKLVADADRAHAKVDEQLARDIHELTNAKFGSAKPRSAKPAKRRRSSTPAGKGETAQAILAALERDKLKLSALAEEIGKTRGNTYNAAKRLVDRGLVVKTDDFYYTLAPQNGAAARDSAGTPVLSSGLPNGAGAVAGESPVTAPQATP